MIEDVEVLYAEIQRETLGKTESAADRKIGLVNGKSAEMQATPFVHVAAALRACPATPKRWPQLKPLIVYLFRFSGL